MRLERAQEIEKQLREVRKYDSPPEEGRSADEWPYPDQWVEHAPPNSLCEAIRMRVGKQGEVLLRTRIESGGWSEYTQEDSWYVAVIVNGWTAWESPVEGTFNGLVKLLEWLEGPPSGAEIEATIASIQRGHVT